MSDEVLKAWNLEADERLRRLMADPYGRFAIRRWLRELGLLEPSTFDHLERTEGRREAAFTVLGDLKRISPDLAGQILSEEVRTIERDRDRSRDRDGDDGDE